MNLFSRRRHPREADERSPYEEALSRWQLAHHADRHDMTLAQAQRLRLHNLGFDGPRMGWIKHLAENGSYDDDQ